MDSDNLYEDASNDTPPPDRPIALQAVVEHLTRKQLKFTVDDDRRAALFRMRGTHGGNFRCVAFISPENDLLQFLTIFPDLVPERRRMAVAEATVRANYGMKLSFFELDFDDGELRVHTASAFPKDDLDDSVIQWCVAGGLAVADRYYEAMQRVIWGDHNPADAIFEAEHPEAAILRGEDEPNLPDPDNIDQPPDDAD